MHCNDPKAKRDQGFTRRHMLCLTGTTLALSAGTKLSARGTWGRFGSGSRSRLQSFATSIEVGQDSYGVPQFLSLRSERKGFEWITPGQRFAPGLTADRRPKLNWQRGAASARDHAMSLRATTAEGLEAQLDIASFANSGAFSWRQGYANAGRSALEDVTRAECLKLQLRPDMGNLVAHCVRRDGDYVREALPLDDVVEVQGGVWNGPSHAGLIIIEVEDANEFLVVGVQLERGWTLRLRRGAQSVEFTVEVHDMQKRIAPGKKLEVAPIFLGACAGALDDAVNLALSHLRAQILPAPAANTPWVGYDIWSTDAKDVEANILAEIPFAAKLGVDLFYLDASWYQGSSKRGTGDWGKGLGSYVEDREKFPRGLRYLSDQVHAAGMKFGLWVGPNIVDEDLVGREISPQWIAAENGVRRELVIPTWQNKLFQVCLGCSDYTRHLQTQLERLVRIYNLDWLKWDNSGLPGIPALCNRDDHGHAAGDGSAAALENEYRIFEYLHKRFPNLILEQCGYGSRLDYGLAGMIGANWCSDTTFPAARVRSNAFACATVYPSSFNAAWVVREDDELFAAKTREAIDASIRSRMVGLFGVGTLNGQMSERASLYPPAIIDRLKHNIAIYRRYRHLLSSHVSFPFKPYGSNDQGWQAIAFNDENADEIVVLCFRSTSTQASARIPMRVARRDATYSVEFMDGGMTRSVDGKTLQRDGIVVKLPAPGASEILLLKANKSAR
jgi:alpha-galactosidase